MSLKIQIERDIESLGAIFSLYRKDSATLGFMPEGAFVQAIADGKIIVVKNSDRLLGYLFFRVSNGRATIVHLCVSSTDRGQGLARLMINELKLITSYLECIILRCRGDFEVNKAWPKFGFHAVSQITGRGADRAKLTVWTFDHGHQNLFSNCTNDKIQVAIDNNIFLDLINPNRPQHEVSNGLTEPWLDDLIELVVTPEIYNDIHRCLKNDELVSTRLKLEKYTKLRASAFDVQKLYEVLHHKYPDLSKGSRGESDVRHIAYSIVAGVKYFVTRDGGILGIAAEISQDYDLQILDPVDLIGRHDLLERESEYQPARLCATQLVTCRLKPEMFEYAIKHFRCKDREKTHQFRDALNYLLCEPRNRYVKIIHDNASQPILLIGVQVDEAKESVCILRLCNHALSPTVLRHSLMEIIRQSAVDRKDSVTIDDDFLNSDIVSALNELGFTYYNYKWVKPLLVGFLQRNLLSVKLKSFGVDVEKLNEDDLNSIIWPAKVANSNQSCYLVPIQSQWAEHFFDTDLAAMRLPEISDIRPELHLGVESVYYSASKNKFIVPGYILWYVSLGNEDMGSMCVKAVSRLRGAVRGVPKDLFRQYRRLGVYEWKQVYEAARFDLNALLIALRFSHTEKFSYPISMKKLQDFGIKGKIQGPRSVPHEIFEQIYKIGTQVDL